MTSNEVATTSSLTERMNYAKALAVSSLLPGSYRNQPANVLYAIEFGRALGLNPVTAVNGIHVIEGKPTASASLISALVRRAGHRLRISGDDERAVAEIVRSDDPHFTYRSEWTLDRAVRAGLCEIRDGRPYARSKSGKPTPWELYPAAMLKARATTEVARDACEEALSGVHYTPEELGADVDVDGEIVAEDAPAGVDTETGEIVDAELVDTPAETAGGAEVVEPEAAPGMHVEPSPAQLRMLGTLMTRAGIKDKPDRLAYCDRIIGHPIESSKDLTLDEFQAVIAALQGDVANIDAVEAGAPDPAPAEPAHPEEDQP